tara:strand:+ start:731 stop:1441 length:711 start_codon:yes stop_codon:yes gene_type:complete
MKVRKNINIKRKLINFYKILAVNGISDLTANHVSVLSNDGKSFYTNQHKYLFSQINEKNLIQVNLNENRKEILKKVNKAGYQIHRFLHMSKAKPKAILHSHSINAVAISTLKKGFIEKLNQSSMRFFKKVKYVNYSAMVLDEKIGKEVAKVVDKKTKLIVLKNHGNIIIADSLEELQHLTFHFEKCCEIQLKVMNSGYDYNLVKNKIALKTSSQHSQFGPVGKMSWNALIKEIKKK